MEMSAELQKLESLIDSARRIPGLGMMIDEGRLRDAIHNLREAVPTEVKQAQQIIAEQTSLIDHAVEESKQIAAAGEQQLKGKVNDSPVVKAATARAREITDAAQARAAAIMSDSEHEAKLRRDETDRYVRQIMDNLDSQLGSLAVSVRKGVSLMESDVRTTHTHRP